MKKLMGFLGLFGLLVMMGCSQPQIKAQMDSESLSGSSKPMQAQGGGQSLSSGPKIAEKPLYTAYNIWIMKQHHMKFINYKYGSNFLPAGTQVHKVSHCDQSDRSLPCIEFETVDGSRSFKITFVSQWHPGKTINDYENYMLTPKNFQELTSGMTEKEIKAIRMGKVVAGMSRDAVLVCYGYPPEHRTFSLNSPVWTYWKNMYITFTYCSLNISEVWPI